MSEPFPPVEVAEAHPALLEMLESLLAEVPEEPLVTPVLASPSLLEIAPAVIPGGLVTETLNIPQTTPLQKTRECVIYGADSVKLETPESHFSAIQFGAGRFRFVAPLNMLDSVVRIEQRPTPMFDQPAWHQGMVVSRGQQLVLVDLGQLLGLSDVAPVAEPDHVLVLPGGRYGIVSNIPPTPLRLRGGDIRWSRYDTRRHWLAGILPTQMCVLVDTEAFLDLLTGEKLV